jgi:hypothetical protein
MIVCTICGSPEWVAVRPGQDAEPGQAICDLAGEFEMTAEEMERQHRIRERAHEIWIERRCLSRYNCPRGTLLEFWL